MTTRVATTRPLTPAPSTAAAEVTGVVLGVVLLIGVLRAWLPSVVTIYGDGGASPRDLGFFAIGWFVAALLAIPLAWVVGTGRLAVGGALTMTLATVAATGASEGGHRQLYQLCVALLGGLVWLVCAAMTVRSGRSAAVGITAGLGLAVALHAGLGTLDLVWRTGSLPTLAQATLGCVFVGCVAAAASWSPSEQGGARRGARGTLWLVAGPAVLLVGVVTGSTSRAEAAAGLPPGYGTWIVVAGSLLAAALAAVPRLTRHPALPGAALVAAVAGSVLIQYRIGGVAGLAPSWTTGCQAAGALALGAVLGWIGAGSDARAATATARDLPLRRGIAAAAGAVLLGALLFAYYAGYGIPMPYPAAAVLLVTAAGLAWAAIAAGPKALRWGAPPGSPRLAWGLAVGAVALVAVVAGAQIVTGSATVPKARPGGFPVRVVSYDIGMGFGPAGRFDPDGVAAAIRGLRADVVLLSEVDRGWFVGGGHDDLVLIAHRLGMRAVFAPAADPVWGDAILTRLPVVSVRSHPLPRAGAAIGAQALAVVLDVGGRELGVIGTHLQPAGGRRPTEQARELGRIARELAQPGRPVVIGGELGLSPSTPEFAGLIAGGLIDGLAAARPLATYPSAQPRDELDHVLTTPDLAASDIAAPRVRMSNHRPVAVTLAYHDLEALRPAPDN
ncbi:MAG: Metal-dependent hydrolase-like protein [Actinomycetia bacterium]|nr:Metal-dependent hydrolase-like protein [Actinomycetes bacterium]